MLRSKRRFDPGPARQRYRRSALAAQTPRIGGPRPRASNQSRAILLDSDVHRLQLFLAAYTTFTDVDVRCLERLAERLRLARVVSAAEMPREVVRMGSHIWIQDMTTCDTKEHVLAFDTEAQAPPGALSILTPPGAALLGARERDEIICPMAGRLTRLRIVKVFRLPENQRQVSAVSKRDAIEHR